MALLRGASLRWDLGLATHAALVVDFEAEVPEGAWMRSPVAALSGPQAPGWADAREGATTKIVESRRRTFHAALAAGGLDEAWCILELAARTWLSWCGGLAEPAPRPH